MLDAPLPILSPGVQLPAAVRDGDQQRQQDYRAALSFERSLLLELTKQLSKTLRVVEADTVAALVDIRALLIASLEEGIKYGSDVSLRNADAVVSYSNLNSNIMIHIDCA